MKRELKFNINDEALLCPNPISFINRSYLGEFNIKEDFKLIPNVKTSTQITLNTFGTVVSKANCIFGNPENILIDEQKIELCPLEIKMQAYQYDLESAYDSRYIAIDQSKWDIEFFNIWLWSELAKRASQEIQQIRWNGNTSLKDNPTLGLCDGYLKKLDDTAGIARVYGNTITSDNIIAVLTSVIAALPEAVRADSANVRIYMSAKNAFLYKVAMLSLNTNLNSTDTMSFVGYKISVQPGMKDSYIVAGSKESFGYAYSDISDYTDIKAVNLDDIGEPIIRICVPLKVSFDLFNTNQIAYYIAL